MWFDLPTCVYTAWTDTAGAYRYKVYRFGTSHTESANVVYTSDRVEITPWTTATTTFDTPDLSPGLYSVWVEAQHPYDSNLAVTATTGESTSYAIGAQHCMCFVCEGAVGPARRKVPPPPRRIWASLLPC